MERGREGGRAGGQAGGQAGEREGSEADEGVRDGETQREAKTDKCKLKKKQEMDRARKTCCTAVCFAACNLAVCRVMGTGGALFMDHWGKLYKAGNLGTHRGRTATPRSTDRTAKKNMLHSGVLRSLQFGSFLSIWQRFAC